MTNAGFATLSIIPSFNGLQSRLSAGVAAPMASAGKTGGKRYGDAAGREAGNRFRASFADRMRGFAPLAGLAAGAGAISVLTSSIKAASEAEQAVGGVRAVFGEYSDDVISKSREAAESLGLSSAAYQELTTLSGALLKNKGIEDFAAQSQTLVEVGADLAAQFGGSTREAVEALNSALRGESDPIERYAISLNESAIKAELAKRGQEGLTGAALEQAKAQARLTLIQQQSADAQGAFARESDTLAGKQTRLSAEWDNMQIALGQKLLPATADFVGFLRNQGLPALSAVGGAVSDAVGAFRALPGPVQAAAGAFAAMRLSSFVGLTGAVQTSVGRMGGAFESMRLRAMLAADAFRQARSGSLQLAGNTGRFVAPVGRMSAALQGLQAGAMGAGGALKRGLGGAMSLIGGPWGAALIGGTVLLMRHMQKNAEAAARVREFTDALDEQTGALTKTNRELAVNTLQSSGALDAARDLGLNLRDVTDAALGNENAMARVKASLNDYSSAQTQMSASSVVAIKGWLGVTSDQEVAARKVRDAIFSQNGVVADSRAAWQNKAEAMGNDAKATDGATRATKSYADRMIEARDAVQKLLDAENRRRLAAVQAKRDQLALIETYAAAKREAREGTRTLNENTAAGRKNWGALLDLSEQWNNSKAKVTNARGAYEAMRQKFIDVAKQMGATEDKAKKMAERFLKVPKRVQTQVDTPGLDKALSDLQRLRAEARLANLTRVRLNTATRFNLQGRASGGPVNAGQSYWVGERGPEIVTFGRNGHVTPNHQINNTRSTTNEVHYHGDIYVKDGRDLTRRARRALGSAS